MDAFLGPASILSAHSPETLSARDPQFLLELEPWGCTFLRNLGDVLLFRRPLHIETTSQPGEFWPDVFVSRPLPWASIFESGLAHIIGLALLAVVGRTWADRPQIVPTHTFDRLQVIYFSPSEYLPPIDTGDASLADKSLRPTQKGQPEYAKQPIVSVPPEADNHEQTVVTPPDIKLKDNISTPNIVAWGDHSVPVPIGATKNGTPKLTLPQNVVAPPPEVAKNANPVSSLAQAVVAPPPEVDQHRRQNVQGLAQAVVVPPPSAAAMGARPALEGPRPAVVAPPPSVETDRARRPGDIKFASTEIIAPAPQLTVQPQRAVPTLNDSTGSVLGTIPPPPEVGGMGNGTGGSHSATTPASLLEAQAAVIPPPPGMQVSGGSGVDGRMIALGIHPAPVAPPEPPRGNRRGEFAATPEGKTGATGTPDIAGEKNTTGASNHSGPGIGAGTTHDAPPGLHVGVPAKETANAGSGGTGGGVGSGSESAGTAGPSLMASARHGGPALPKAVVDASADPVAGPVAQQVLGPRRIYAMTLNMPNLNSGGGSWVIRFAELNESSDGDLTAPVPEHKVDPAYPIELMRQNVGGTVALRAVIRADGSVGDVRVVRSVDDRLDRYASEALSHWHFYPATRNGIPVDLEAVVMIPFKPIHRRNF